MVKKRPKRKSRNKPYANAKDVLPKSLLDRVRKQFEGGLLYVTTRLVGGEQAARQIRVLLDAGEKPKDIAPLFDLTPRRVYQIQAEMNKKPRLAKNLRPEETI
jgi:hypothetical protein